MNSRFFTSNQGWFSLTLPGNWDKYDDEDETTYAFSNTTEWTGNLRITPLKNDNADNDLASTLTESLLIKEPDAKQINLRNFKAVHYERETNNDEYEMLIYHWTMGQKNIVFICSFTIDKSKQHTEKNKKELMVVEQIIASIHINFRS